MGQELNGNKIVEKENGYVVETKKRYSKIINNGYFIIAYSIKQEEIVVYDKDFMMLKKITHIKKLEEYQYKNVVFVAFTRQYDKTGIIILQDDKYDIVTLMNEYGDSVEFYKMHCIEPKKYLVIGEYSPYVEGYGYCNTKYVFFVINLNKGETLLQNITSHNSYKLIGNRFLNLDGIYDLYDLYTMTKIEWPKGIIETTNKIEVCCSRKQILILKIGKRYYVYIKGKIVYTYLKEEHEQILFGLKNYYTWSKDFCTVIIKDKICIWNKNSGPEIISIPKQ